MWLIDLENDKVYVANYNNGDEFKYLFRYFKDLHWDHSMPTLSISDSNVFFNPNDHWSSDYADDMYRLPADEELETFLIIEELWKTC